MHRTCYLINPWHRTCRRCHNWVGIPGRPPYVTPCGSAGWKNTWYRIIFPFLLYLLLALTTLRAEYKNSLSHLILLPGGEFYWFSFINSGLADKSIFEYFSFRVIERIVRQGVCVCVRACARACQPSIALIEAYSDFSPLIFMGLVKGLGFWINLVSLTKTQLASSHELKFHDIISAFLILRNGSSQRLKIRRRRQWQRSKRYRGSEMRWWDIRLQKTSRREG